MKNTRFRGNLYAPFACAWVVLDVGTCKERSDGIASKQMRLVRASQIRHTALRTVKQKDLQSQVFVNWCRRRDLNPHDVAITGF